MATSYPKILTNGILTASAVSQYTTSQGFTVIKQIIICNSDDDTNKTFSIWAVKSGGSVDTSSMICNEVSLGPGESAFINPSLFLGIGDKIYASASVTDVVGITITGVEVY